MIKTQINFVYLFISIRITNRTFCLYKHILTTKDPILRHISYLKGYLAKRIEQAKPNIKQKTLLNFMKYRISTKKM